MLVAEVRLFRAMSGRGNSLSEMNRATGRSASMKNGRLLQGMKRKSCARCLPEPRGSSATPRRDTQPSPRARIIDDRLSQIGVRREWQSNEHPVSSDVRFAAELVRSLIQSLTNRGRSVGSRVFGAIGHPPNCTEKGPACLDAGRTRLGLGPSGSACMPRSAIMVETPGMRGGTRVPQSRRLPAWTFRPAALADLRAQEEGEIGRKAAQRGPRPSRR
jgi:hypothetical protein